MKMNQSVQKTVKDSYLENCFTTKQKFNGNDKSELVLSIINK